MEGDHIRINRWLMPLCWFYGTATALRNTLYNIGVLKSHTYGIPIIDVGNITVGGTGKTPHIEYLVRLLSPHYRVAILSRGYKRKSRGYVLATADTPMQQIGDEPWQMKQKYPHIHVAVDADRCRGIRHLCTDQATRDVQVILLDDAFQYRRVKPGLNILLVDYHRMITDDRLLPAGRLREKPEGKDRADLVVVTKCPANINPMGFRVLRSALRLKPFQSLFYSTIRYGQPVHIDHTSTLRLDELKATGMHVLLLSGIGRPAREHLRAPHRGGDNEKRKQDVQSKNKRLCTPKSKKQQPGSRLKCPVSHRQPSYWAQDSDIWPSTSRRCSASPIPRYPTSLYLP